MPLSTKRGSAVTGGKVESHLPAKRRDGDDGDGSAPMHGLIQRATPSSVTGKILSGDAAVSFMQFVGQSGFATPSKVLLSAEHVFMPNAENVRSQKPAPNCDCGEILKHIPPT